MMEVPDNLKALLEVAVCLVVSDEEEEEEEVEQHRQEQLLREDVLCCVLPDYKSVVSSMLKDAVNRGFLCESGGPDTYAFVSRKKREVVQQALFLNPKSARDAIHQKIGRRILRSGLDDALALRQFSLTESSLVQSASEDTLYRLAETCLRVGTEFARSSEFHQASATLQFGIRLLPVRHWRDQYDLSLNLHQMLAEASHGCSDFDRALEAVDCVKANARKFRDTISMISIEIYILGLRGRRRQAMEIGLSALRKLGLSINSNPSKFRLLQIIVQSRLLERKNSPEKILRLPEMTDENSLHKIKLLNLLFPLAFSTFPKLMPIVTFQMVKLVCEQGLGVMAPVAFGMNGMLQGSLGQTASALRNAKLALELYGRFPSREWLPRVYASVYGGVYACTRPPETTLEPLSVARAVGLETGDTEFSTINGLAFTYSLFASGKPLPDVEEHLLRLYATATQTNQIWNRFFLSAFLQFVQNLTGKARSDPGYLIGDFFDEANIDMASLDHTAKLVWPTYSMFVSFLFGKYERAAEAAKQCSGVERFPSGHTFLTYASLFQGLSATGLAIDRGRSRKRTARVARHHCRVLKRRAYGLPSAGSSKYSLLKADLLWLKGHHKSVYFHYSQAIASASHNGLPFDLALSHERLGRYLLIETQDEGLALSHLRQACDAYVRWGATAKAEHLDAELSLNVKQEESP